MKFKDHLPKIIDLKIYELNNEINLTDIANRFSKQEGTVFLLSGGVHDCSKYNILGIDPWLKIKTKSKQITLDINKKYFTFYQSPFVVLKKIIKYYKFDTNKHRDVNFLCGLMGYISYDLKDEIEDLPSYCIDDLNLPDILFYCHKLLFVENINTKDIKLIIPQFEGEAAPSKRDILDFIEKKEFIDEGYSTNRILQSNFEKQEYMEAVEKIKDYIVRGHVYQVNMSQRFVCSFTGNGFSLFLDLFNLNPAPFFAYIKAEDHEIISTSPERFLHQKGKYVETRPIKGTRPRGKTDKEDKELENELKNSIKDDAELSMIVDLLRNDLGKVCKAGSIKVSEHKRIEKYKNVFHLVSIVTGELNEDSDSIDLIKATFPGGSITGCPKIRSMEIIEELEKNKRHIYTGSIGYISFHNTMDLSIAIRTSTIINNKLIFSVGGAVVFDSDPLLEYEETLHKGQSFIKLLKKYNKSYKNPNENFLWINGSFKNNTQAKIDINTLVFQYGAGLFETILWANKKIYFLEEHINRLKNSWIDLFNLPFPELTFKDIILELIYKNKLDEKMAAIKIIMGVGKNLSPPYDTQVILTTREYVPRIKNPQKQGLKVGIFPQKRQTPLASHKSLNYLFYLKAKQWAESTGYQEAIILNPDGSISEGNSTNIVCRKDKKIYLPESDNFLQGIMLTKVVKFLKDMGLDITTKKIYPEELSGFDEVIMTNSLIGALSIDTIDNKVTFNNKEKISFMIYNHFFAH